ncbi:MAG: DUF2631 domain-containing protein [Micromonosporaceae bacterium]|nr:DUF2631 domain-containing protein [Micromonosporaceae bacterium]
MLPARVSISIPAWPVPVSRTARSSVSCDSQQITAARCVPPSPACQTIGVALRGPHRQGVKDVPGSALKEHHVADEPITSPDQRKPENIKLTRILVIVGSLGLLSMVLGNHQGNVENLWLVGLAASGLGWVVIDWVLRRNGLR